jgi:hypothetical protein
MKAYRILIIASCILFLHKKYCSAKEVLIIETSQRVNIQSNKLHKDIANLVNAYLLSVPDTVNNNPYWNEEEQKIFKIYDFALYNMHNEMKNYHKLYRIRLIDIIETNLDSFYQVKLMFSSKDTCLNENSLNPYCIISYRIKLVNNKYKMFSNSYVLLKKWQRINNGGITYYISPNMSITEKELTLNDRFIDSINTVFNIQRRISNYRYYACANTQEMAEIQGFDYYLGAGSGQAINENKQIFAANKTIHYPHEIVHAIFAEYKPHSILEEGLAVYLGGTGSGHTYKAYKNWYTELKQDTSLMIKLQSLSFDELLKNRFQIGSTSLYYVTGALLIDHIIKTKGITILKKILLYDSNNFYIALEKEAMIRPEELDKLFKSWFVVNR